VAAPVDTDECSAGQHGRERLGDHDAQDGRIAGPRGCDSLSQHGRAEAGFNMDEVG
jgi:hypothetical protein